MSEEKYDSRPDTLKHINRVFDLIQKSCQNLANRAIVHDKSKLEEPEKSEIDRCTIKLQSIRYDTPEYNEALKELKPMLIHHYANNSHHPEHWKNGVNDMSLLDILEMLMDWKAATERMKDGGDIWRSIDVNKERFGLSDQLVSILKNTAKEMGW